MAKQHRKSHRHHNKRKHSRKTHRKQQQRKQKQQRGGSANGCAYQAQNRQAFQMGGMAPFVAGDAYLLDAATRVQAEVAPLDKSFAELPSVILHRGGARHRHSHKQQSRRQRQRSQRQKRQQRGGMAPFDAPYTTGVAHQAQNAQFQTEGTVNALYHENKGPQGF